MNELYVLRKGYAEPAPVGASSAPVQYGLHHGMINPEKPEELRVVFDCASGTKGVSLNQLVYPGPDLINSVTGVLMNSRRGSVGFTADIEAMFNQAKASPEHRDALHFLWWSDGKLRELPSKHGMTTHLFGGVWSPSRAVAQPLKANHR